MVSDAMPVERYAEIFFTQDLCWRCVMALRLGTTALLHIYQLSFGRVGQRPSDASHAPVEGLPRLGRIRPGSSGGFLQRGSTDLHRKPLLSNRFLRHSDLPCTYHPAGLVTDIWSL